MSLNVKARAYWCVPLRRFDMEKEMIGIVSFDTMLPDAFNSDNFKNDVSVAIIAEIESFCAGMVI